MRQNRISAVLIAVSVCVGSFLGCGSSSSSDTSSGCSAANCKGCCFNGTCQPGNTAAGCGKDGEECNTCGPNLICNTEQKCRIDPESTWVVQPTTATIESSNNGATWDGDGSPPDVVVNMTCSGSSTSTPKVESLTPSWTSGGCVSKASALMSEGFTFQLVDVDVTANDSITGNLHYKVSDLDLASGNVPLEGSGGMKGITFTFTKK